jgi:hypothetical protein
MLWITLVVSILKVEFENTILVASPKDSLDSIAVEHRARRYWAGDIRDISRSGSGVGGTQTPIICARGVPPGDWGSLLDPSFGTQLCHANLYI